MSQQTIICQGREVTDEDLKWLRNIIGGHKDWSRCRIGKEVCRQWQWQTAGGQYKTFAAREFLMKLNNRGLIKLPPLREKYRCNSWSKPTIEPVIVETEVIKCSLSELQPLKIVIPAKGSAEDARFKYYLATHHYLGFRKTVGENIKYLIKDRQGRDIACLLFGSAAWKTAPRDRFIGWDSQTRQRNVNLLTNNTRYLILPWVEVKHLASHILGLVMRRIGNDWQAVYSHAIHLVETFVERDRFRGTCYKAANWRHIGETKGRSRQDRDNTMQVPVKDIYVYPLIGGFREALNNDSRH